MKYRCFAALALAMLLPGCAAAPDLTPVWQRDLPASGVHIELANAALLSDADVYYAATREELYVHNVSVLPAVKADGQPVVTFYGAAAQDIDLVYLEDIGDVYVDYDRVKPQIKLDYILTEGDGYVSYELDTAYNFEFTVTTQTGEDRMRGKSARFPTYGQSRELSPHQSPAATASPDGEAFAVVSAYSLTSSPANPPSSSERQTRSLPPASNPKFADSACFLPA